MRRFERVVNVSDEESNAMPMNLQFFSGKADGVDDSNDDVEEPEDEEDGDADEDGGVVDQAAEASGAKGKAGKVFTQKQVSRMMAREKNQGRAAALKELGLDPKDARAASLVKAFISSQKTDEQIEAEKANEESEKLREAEDRALKAECKAEAMVLGAKKEYVDDVMVLAMAKYEEGSDFKTIIGEIKTKYSSFFDGGNEEDGNKAGKKGTGSSMAGLGKKDKEKDQKSIGARLAAQRKPSKGSTSNFSRK